MARAIPAVLVTGALLLLALMAFLLDTTAGARFLAREVEGFSDGTVEIGEVSGTLAGGLGIRNLRIDAGTVRLQVRELALEWQVFALLRGRVAIDALRVARIEVHAGSDAPASDAPWQMPVVAVPLPIEIRRLEVASFEWRRAGTVVALADQHLAARLQESTLTLIEWRGRFVDPAAELAWRLSGSARLEPDLPLDLRFEWQLAKIGISGGGTVRGTLEELRVAQQLALPALSEPVEFAATLHELDAAARFAAEARSAGFSSELPGIGILHVRDGRLDIHGTFERWEATLGASAQGARVPALQLDAAAAGDFRRMSLARLALTGAAGRLVAQGEIDLAPARGLRLDLDLADFDTRVLRPGLEGRISLQGRLEVQPDNAVSLQVARLAGRLMGRSIAGSGQLGYDSGTLALKNVQLRAGENRLAANVMLGPRLDGRFDLDAPDLAPLWPGLSGALAVHASLGGTRAQPRIDADADGTSLALDGQRIRSADLQLRIGADQRADARLMAQGIEIDGRDLGALEVGLLGKVAAHTLRLRLHGGLIDAALESAGGWDGKRLHHVMGAASLGIEGFGNWHMEGAPRLDLGTTAAAITAHCWRDGQASLCIDAADWTPARAQLVAKLRAFELQRLAAWAPAHLAMSGQAEADAALAFSSGALLGTLAWRQQDTLFRYTGGDEPLEMRLDQVDATAEFSPRELQVTLALAGPQGVTLDTNATLGLPLAEASTVDARVVAKLPDVAMLLPWVAADFDLADVAGHLAIDLALGGSLHEPRFSGAARLADGSLAFTDAGIKLEDMEVVLYGDGSPVLHVQGLARAGGRLSLAGELRPLDKAGPGGQLRLRGNQIEVVRLPDRLVTASPDLVLAYADGALLLGGEVAIPKADIVVRELPNTAVSPSPDTVLMDRETYSARVTARQLVRGEIALRLGPDVRLRGFGLDTRLAGTLKLSQADDGTPRGFGVVRLVEGRVGAYGKALHIEHGTLGFTGPLDDPAVDVRAVREIEWEGTQVTAGIELGGTASRPQSRIFSEPAMAEADALSYLIAGRPLQSTGTGDRSAIAGAALALGVQQASPLTGRIGGALALDELGVQADSLDETEVVAGKQLGSDLYLRLSYGLFNRIATVLARYRLGRHISIEAASGEEQSLDLVYSTERP